MPATLIYDGQCPFCTRSARRLQHWAGTSRLKIIPLDAPDAMQLHSDLEYAKALAAVQLILPSGRLCSGAEAAFQAMALKSGFGFLKIPYYIPILRQISDLAYRIIARNRRRCDSCQP